ncbi:MAG: preprotein translocase subunit SecG [Chthoniobacteraceae bacterium]
MLPIVINVLLVIHVLVSLLIILLVLMQRPKNEGLGAAFGGGATDQLFGAQTTNVLQTITRWLGGIFFVLTLLLSILYVKQGGGRGSIQGPLTAPTIIPALPTPTPGAPDPNLPPGAVDAPLTPGAANPAILPGAIEQTPILDGDGPVKLEMAPGKPGEAVSEPVKPELPAVPLEKFPKNPPRLLLPRPPSRPPPRTNPRKQNPPSRLPSRSRPSLQSNRRPLAFPRARGSPWMRPEFRTQSA